MGPESKKPYNTEVYNLPKIEQRDRYSYVPDAAKSLSESQGNIESQLKGMMNALDKNFESQDLGLMGVNSKFQQKFATFLTGMGVKLEGWNKMDSKDQKRILEGYLKDHPKAQENKILHNSSAGMEKYNILNKGYYSQAQIEAAKAKEAQVSQKKVDGAIRTSESKTSFNANAAEFKANDSMNSMALGLIRDGGDNKTPDKGKDNRRDDNKKTEIKDTKITSGVNNKEGDKDKRDRKDQAPDAKTDKKENKKTENKNNEKKETKLTPKTVEQRIKEMKKSMNLSEDEKKKLTDMEAKNVNALQYDMNYYLEKNKNATKEEKDAYKGHLIRKYTGESAGGNGEKLPEKGSEQKVQEGSKSSTDKGTGGQNSVDQKQEAEGYTFKDGVYYSPDGKTTFIPNKDGNGGQVWRDGKQLTEKDLTEEEKRQLMEAYKTQPNKK